MKSLPLDVIAVSAISTAAVSPVVREWLRSHDLLDVPNDRSSHTRPTPRGAGIACGLGGATGVAHSFMTGRRVSARWIGSSVALGLVGRLDDRVGLSPVPRLTAQVVTGVLVGSSVAGPVRGMFGPVLFPVVVNAFNFMDGINGISAGTAAAWGILIGSDRSLNPSVRVQGALTAGMALGFLPFNVPTAQMFLGDVGSYLIGAGISTSVAEASFSDGVLRVNSLRRVVAPLIPYFADTGSTLVKRMARGESIAAAHREHAYQRLVAVTGWPHWTVSSLVSGAAAVCGLLGRSRSKFVFAIPVVACYLAAPSVLARRK